MNLFGWAVTPTPYFMSHECAWSWFALPALILQKSVNMSSPGIAVAEGSSASGDNKRFAGQIDNANARKAKRRREVEERAERERLRVETGAPIQPPYVWGMRVPITGIFSFVVPIKCSAMCVDDEFRNSYPYIWQTLLLHSLVVHVCYLPWQRIWPRRWVNVSYLFAIIPVVRAHMGVDVDIVWVCIFKFVFVDFVPKGISRTMWRLPQRNYRARYYFVYTVTASIESCTRVHALDVWIDGWPTYTIRDAYQ